jgi:hypothetical protein
MLAQNVMRSVPLGCVVDQHHDKSISIRQLFPGQIKFVQVVPEAQIEPGQEPTDASPANRLIQP